VSDRALLERLQRGLASGVVLAAELGLTRGAVWKRIEALRAAGVDIRASPAGYALAQPLELLDRGQILTGLEAGAKPLLSSLALEFETDSTQARALSVEPPASGCAAWLAERQTAGQGRRGRAWVSPLAAHLYLSLSRRFELGFAALSGLSLAVGIVVAEALREEGYPQVGLKWPNDLWAGDRKLGGILVQLRGEMQGPCSAVVGLGLNVSMPEREAVAIDQPWCDLRMLAPERLPSRNRLAALLLSRIVLALEEFETAGWAAFQPRWNALDALAGRQVRVVEGERQHEGIALGLAADGALRVRLPGGERCFHGGEASLRPA
jgi:BirA family biotin operon repressor/biotin-[acetyl-CoA-carboxylase] ligase